MSLPPSLSTLLSMQHGVIGKPTVAINITHLKHNGNDDDVATSCIASGFKRNERLRVYPINGLTRDSRNLCIALQRDTLFVPGKEPLPLLLRRLIGQADNHSEGNSSRSPPMGDNADNTTYSYRYRTASIYYNEAAIGRRKKKKVMELVLKAPSSSFLSSLPLPPFLFAVPIYQSSNKLISDIDLPRSLPSFPPIPSILPGRRKGRREGRK